MVLSYFDIGSKAGEAYINAGMCYFAAGDDHDCSKAYNDAAVCYKKVSIDGKFLYTL